MADQTLAKLVSLISASDSPELRRAAVVVAGNVGTAKEKSLIAALLTSLGDADLDMRLAAIEALGHLHADEALAPLQDLVRRGGPEVEAAVRAASQLGARGLKALSKIMDGAAPALRSRMAGVLAKSGTGGGLVVTAHALLDPDPKVVDTAARSLATEVPTFSGPQKQALAKFLSESLTAKGGLPVKTEAAMVRLLGIVPDARAPDILWVRLTEQTSPEVRAAALQALSHGEPPTTDARLQHLVRCAAHADFQIVAHALMILKKVQATSKNTKVWLKLLDAPDVATRRFAVEKLSGLESAEVARGLVNQLGHPDRQLQGEATQALLGFAKGRQALLEKLTEGESAEACWDLARRLAPVAQEFSSSLRPTLFARAASYHDHNDRRAAPLWYFLRALDANWTRDQVAARAFALRKKKKYAEAVGYYRLLAQDPACAEEIRFELAATGLKVSNHDAAVEARQADHALAQFGRLLQNPAFDLSKRVTAAKWLDNADLFYLGFHFAEQTHRARDFGKQVLELVVQRAGKTELGKNARKKLKSAGLG